MEEEELEDLDYQRGTWLLTNKFHNVLDLTDFWIMVGPYKHECPEVERVYPWFKDFSPWELTKPKKM